MAWRIKKAVAGLTPEGESATGTVGIVRKAIAALAGQTESVPPAIKKTQPDAAVQSDPDS